MKKQLKKAKDCSIMLEKYLGGTAMIHTNKRGAKAEMLHHQMEENLNYQCHTHHNYEAVYCLGGQINLNVDGREYILTQGKGVLIMPGHIHSYTTPSQSKIYICVFSTELVGAFYKQTKNSDFSDISFTFTSPREIQILTDKSKSVFTKVSVLFALCGRVFEQSKITECEPTRFALINSLSMYVQNNFTKDIKLKSIAKEFGYDYSYLSSFFNDNFGTDFSSYLNKYRVQYAMGLLKNTDKSVSDISLESGYSTVRNFNIVFKKETDLTPKEWREANNAKQ